MKRDLEACYNLLKRRFGEHMEPIEVIERLEDHRNYWRPNETRVVLLAESHVLTSSPDLKRFIKTNQHLPPDLPMSFVRWVYCLGYGENHLLDQQIVKPRNTGTSQFWRIFMSCLDLVATNADFSPVLVSRTPTCSKRIENKLSVLRRLKASGVWLVDASIAALYGPGRPKPKHALMQSAIHISWDEYVGSVIADVRPSAILCVGVGVARALDSRLNKIGVPWRVVQQPNARLSTSEHFRNYKIYRSVCADPDMIHTVPHAW